MAVTCPICGDYEGDPQQVQAHIQAKQDEAHEGKSGREYAAEIDQQAAKKPSVVKNGEKAASSPGSRQSGQQPPQNSQQNGKEVPHRGGRSRGTTVDIPDLVCKGCGRKVKYPELMTYVATCAGCGRRMRKRDAFEKNEQQADEKGKNELAEVKEV